MVSSVTGRMGVLVVACSLWLAGCESSSRPGAQGVVRGSDHGETRHGVELSPGRIDLGVIPIGTQKNFRTTLVNRGNHPIVIEKIETHCGCADVKTGTMRLEAGDRTELSGTLRAGNRPRLLRHGVAVIVAGHPRDPLQLKLTGTVEPTIAVSGELTVSPDFLAAKPTLATLMVHNKSADPIELTGFHGLPAGLRGHIARRLLPPGEKSEVVFECAPVFMMDQDGEIILTTSHLLEEAVPIRYRIRPAGALTCVPTAIRVGVVARQELQQRNEHHLVIRGQSLRQLELGHIEVPEFVEFIGSERAADGSLDLVFRFVDSSSSTFLDGVAIIHLAVRGSDRTVGLRLPFSGIIRDTVP